MNASKGKLSLLVLEPYYGGSHRTFLEGLMNHLPFEFTLLDMPARKWKWRMRLAAQEYATILKREGRSYDRVVCSTFVDVAALRSLGPRWLCDVPVLTYFHENQFDYPVQVDDERDMHFALTNMTTAMASDSLAFNSSHNLESFLSGISDALRLAPDMRPADPTESIRDKSVVLSPGMDFSAIDSAPEADRPERAVILWNHRWEHDKNPEAFFNCLFTLDKEGHDFGLLVLGESFERKPSIFDAARERLADHIVHFGYVQSREDYARLLKTATVAVSTSTHEFFGISMLEAARAGAVPLAPRRLSYPELFPDNFIYEDRDLRGRLSAEILSPRRLSKEQTQEITDRHSWEALSGDYTRWIEGSSV